MGGKSPDAEGAAEAEGYWAGVNADNALFADRMNTFTDFGNTTYTPYMHYDEATGTTKRRWQQDNLLHPAWAETLGQQREIVNHQTGVQQGMLNQWGAAPIAAEQYFGYSKPNMGKNDFRAFGQTGPTIGADQWQQFGYSNPTTGANDYQQFGTTNQTTGADDWREFGTTGQTIGAGDWRQFGNAEQTIHSGDFDQRFGSGRDNPYGDHDMGNGNWNYIDYAPEAIRNRAYDDVYQSNVNKLDPQFAQKREALEVQLRNQGLQMGDQAYDAAVSSFDKSRNMAYEDARLNSMDASRAEASMLWDQEMGRSEQKNQYHQADIDNAYRARQANIQNYLSGRGQDMQGYLDYQNSAFDQDMQRRQLELESNLGYGREAYNQDLQSRQQQLDADLRYGNQAWEQDYRGRQQQLDSDLAYGDQAYRQDYQSRQQALDNQLRYGQANYDQRFQQQQANVDNYLNYADSSYQQNYQGRQQAMDAYLRSQQLQNERYGLLDSTGRINAVTEAFGGGG